jgi:hypothetical protein
MTCQRASLWKTADEKRFATRKKSSKRGKTATKTAPKTAKRVTERKTKSRVRRSGRSGTRKQPAQLPRQKIQVPRIEPGPRVEFDLDGSARWLKRMDGRNTRFICKLEWSWTRFNERMESYYLQPGRTHWILWRKPFDDNWGRWEKPIAIARCPWKGLSAGKDAAMLLLAAVLAEEIRFYDSDPGRFGINDDGLLCMEELDAVADAVWGDSGAAEKGNANSSLVTHAKALETLRSGEPPLGSLTSEERSWLATAFARLNRIYEKREAGRPGKNAFCIFEVGKVYVQFLASWDAETLLCEAVSAKSVPEIAPVLKTEGEEALQRFGFKAPEVSPNYSQLKSKVFGGLNHAPGTPSTHKGPSWQMPIP